MNVPFKVTCDHCGTAMQLFNDELDWQTTKADPITQIVPIDFFCIGCSHLTAMTYLLPVFSNHAVRNLMRGINQQVCVNSWDVLGTITLDTPVEGSALYASIIEGMRYAVAKLEGQGILYEVDYDAFSFRLTLLGWIALLHSAY